MRYSLGLGVALDTVVAYKWLMIAGERGSKLGREQRQIVEAKMPPKDIAEAETLARAWLARHGKK